MNSIGRVSLKVAQNPLSQQSFGSALLSSPLLPAWLDPSFDTSAGTSRALAEELLAKRLDGILRDLNPDGSNLEGQPSFF